MSDKIKVLIIDDSALVRQTLTKILFSDSEIEVVGAVRDPYAAAKRMKEVTPDVILLDTEMPRRCQGRMDGATLLQKVTPQNPLPVVMCLSLAEIGSETTLKAWEYGAVDIKQKPKLGVRESLEESKIAVCDSVKAAASAHLRKARPVPHHVSPKLTADVIMPRPADKSMVTATEKVVVVGASTGGTEAIRVFLEALPEDAPGMVIVQHMPENFTRAFAQRLDGICKVSVKEADDDDTVIRGRALIAPGNRHTLLKRNGARYYVEVRDGPLVSRHRPSVDVLFRSAARCAGRNVVGVIMTGMGDDGAKGMLEMKEQGAYTIAQDEGTCVVFGMPKEAIMLSAVERVVPLEAMASVVLHVCREA